MNDRPVWPIAAAAAVLLSVAAPGALPAPLAAASVLLGLAAFYAAATRSRRPYRTGYLIGLGYLLAVSWSLRHVTWLGFVAIGVVGAVYFLLVVAWTRARAGLRLPPALAFGCGVAVTQWLRAHAPEIPYPHAQPVHALYAWPGALGPVRWGGEALGNLLLAAIGAAAVDAFRAWRVAHPPWRPAARVLAIVTGVWVLSCALPTPGASVEGPRDPVRVVAIEPGFAPMFQLSPRTFLEAVDRELARPTVRLAGPDAADPPALVVWPEGAYPVPLEGDPPRLVRRWPLPLARGTRLLAGTGRVAPEGGRHATAVLVDGAGRLVGWQDKIVPVPAGERLPFVSWLPASWEAALRGQLGVLGTALDVRGGRRRPPMTTADGTPFAALTCYDNAFAGVVEEAVDGGAQFLCVLSNESWYRGGAELEQMVAMTVCRALETATPVIRCTVDGVTMLVTAAGGAPKRLPTRGPGDRRHRVFDVAVTPGPGALPPLAWLHDACVFAILATALGMIAQALRSWARLRAAAGGPAAGQMAGDDSTNGGLDDA